MEGEGTQQGVMGGWYGHAGWVPSPPLQGPATACTLPAVNTQQTDCCSRQP